MLSQNFSSLLASSDEDDDSVRGCPSKRSFHLRIEDSGDDGSNLPTLTASTESPAKKRPKNALPLDLSTPAGSVDESVHAACGGPDEIHTPSSFSFLHRPRLTAQLTSTPATSHNTTSHDVSLQLMTENMQKIVKEETKDMKEAIDHQTSVLEECLQLLKKLDVGAAQKKTAKTATVLVPAQIKQAVRDGYKFNKNEKDLTWTTKTIAGTILKYNSEENKDMSEAMLVYVKGQYPSTEEGVIRAGIEKYFTTVKQKRRMEASGSKEDHKRKMVMYGRKNRKIQNRTKSLKSKNLPREEEEKILEALAIEYMSSEDSDSEDEMILVSRPLPWVSAEFKAVISKLDLRYQKQLNAQGKRLRSKRIVGRPSTRSCPKKPEGLAWIFS